MKVAYLIGFQYLDHSSEKPLPGIIVDLYSAYCFVEKMGAEIRVVTDLTRDIETSYVRDVIINGVVNSSILNFIETLRSRKQLYTDLSFEGISNMDQLFFYFTGHGRFGSLVFPDRLIESRVLLGDLIQNSTPKAEIFLILDCCDNNSLNFPLIFQGDRWELRKPILTLKFHSQSIIYMTPTQIGDTSSASRNGSTFSLQLFKALKGNIRCFTTLMTLAQFHLFTTDGEVDSLWSWIWNDQLPTIVFNQQYQVFSIKKSKSMINGRVVLDKCR